MKRHAFHRGLLVLGIALFACACSSSGDKEATDSWHTQVLALIGAKADLPPEISKIELIVSGSGMKTIQKTLKMADLDTEEDVFFSVSLTAGERVFAINCLNQAGFGLYRGVRTVRVGSVDLDLTINLKAYAVVRGRIVYLDGTPLADYEETAFDLELSTDSDGDYRVETPIGEVILQAQPTADLISFSRVSLTEPGEVAQIDLVLIPTADDTQPWIASAAPSKRLAIGQTIAVFGRGFSVGTDLTVWFGQPEAMVEANVPAIHSDNDLTAIVPESAPTSGWIAVCWTGNLDCSNLFPYDLAP